MEQTSAIVRVARDVGTDGTLRTRVPVDGAAELDPFGVRLTRNTTTAARTARGEETTQCRRAEAELFSKGNSKPVRHNAVQDRIDGGVEIEEATC